MIVHDTKVWQDVLLNFGLQAPTPSPRPTLLNRIRNVRDFKCITFSQLYLYDICICIIGVLYDYYGEIAERGVYVGITDIRVQFVYSKKISRNYQSKRLT